MPRSGRASGLTVDPARVRQARIAAGLSLAEVAGHEVSRTMIHFVESGQSQPSRRVLRLIARRTRKPMSYFLLKGDDESDSDVAAELSAAAARLKRFANAHQLAGVERDALLLAQATLRQTAALARTFRASKTAPSDAAVQGKAESMRARSLLRRLSMERPLERLPCQFQRMTMRAPVPQP